MTLDVGFSKLIIAPLANRAMTRSPEIIAIIHIKALVGAFFNRPTMFFTVKI